MATLPKHEPANPPVPETAVVFRVWVPADAVIWFNGTKTSQQGVARQFISPALEPNRPYSYTIWAKWTENGQEVGRSQKVQVFAGDRVTVDLREQPKETAPEKVLPPAPEDDNPPQS